MPSWHKKSRCNYNLFYCFFIEKREIWNSSSLYLIWHLKLSFKFNVTGSTYIRQSHIMGHMLVLTCMKRVFFRHQQIFHYQEKVMQRRHIAIHIYVWALFGCAGDLVYKLLALRESKQIFGSIYFSFGRLCFERFFSENWLISTLPLRMRLTMVIPVWLH